MTVYGQLKGRGFNDRHGRPLGSRTALLRLHLDCASFRSSIRVKRVIDAPET